MRHFLFEFITGGGMIGQALPKSLANEGDMMLRALVDDLSSSGDKNIIITRDSRLGLLDKHDIEQHVIYKNIKENLSKIVRKEDIVWLIAPETDKTLIYYAKFFLSKECRLLASSIDILETFSNKKYAFEKLQENKIATIDTKTLKQGTPHSKSGWVVKPVYGAGADNCRFFLEQNKIVDFIGNKNIEDYIIQPFLEGINMSASLLVNGENIYIISCNRQYIKLQGGHISLDAIGVNEYVEYLEPLKKQLKKIIKNIPGFATYIGVDLIFKDGQFFVVEINPRLTTSYVALSKSLGFNIATLILDVFLSNRVPNIVLSEAEPIKIYL